MRRLQAKVDELTAGCDLSVGARPRPRPRRLPPLVRRRAARRDRRRPVRVADRRRQVQPHLRGHRRHVVVDRAPPAARPRAGDRARHGPRVHRDDRRCADTGVPVPRTYAHCADDSVLGAPFYVMERVDGRRLPHGGRARRARHRAHRRDRRPAGRRARRAARRRPGGRRAGGLRPARRASSSGRCAAGASSSRAPKTRDLPDADELHRRLAERRARPRTRRRPGSCTATTGSTTAWSAPTTGSRAVLDWEMATLGDPLTDLALLLVYETAGRLGRRRPGRRRRQAPGLPGRPSSSSRAYAAASGREPRRHAACTSRSPTSSSR